MTSRGHTPLCFVTKREKVYKKRQKVLKCSEKYYGTYESPIILVRHSHKTKHNMITEIMYQSNQSLNIPPGQPPGHLNFWRIFVQIPSSRGRKAVQMPHHRSIPSYQMPSPLGKLFRSFYYAPESKLCRYVNMV